MRHYKTKRTLCLALILLIFLTGCAEQPLSEAASGLDPARVEAAAPGASEEYAEKTGSPSAGCKTVRVGYYSGEQAFQDGFSDTERKSGYAYEFYQAIGTPAGWSYDYVYGSRDEIMEKLLAGEVDIMAGVRPSEQPDQLLFSSRDMNGRGLYFAVAPGRQDLLSDLDFAIDQLLRSQPAFIVTLWQKYYTRETERGFTEQESVWLETKDTLRFGYVRHNLPLSDQGLDGQPDGLVKDLIERLSENMRLELIPVCYENISYMEAALSAGEIDVAFPVYSDLWLSEVKGFRQTASFLSDRVMVIYRGDYDAGLMDRVALSSTGIGQKYFLEANYPDSEITFYDSREDALDAVRDERERCIVGCSSILQRFLREHPEYQSLNIAYLDSSETFGMAAQEDEYLLAGILDKVLQQIGPAEISSSLMRYSSVDRPITLHAIMQDYSLELITLLLMVFAVLLFVFINYRRKTVAFNREQAETSAALEKAAEEAKRANEAKTTFLSSMSHDIRTPMNAIVGMTAIAVRHINDRSRVEECLNKISLSSHHLLTLINNILDISKIESGKLALNPVVFSLRDTVNTLVNIVRPQLKEKDIQFDIHLYNMDHERICADEVRVNQIFINILTNAVKYTPEGGKVILDLREEPLPEGLVRLTYIVEDNGIGMSKEFMQNMYEIFSRAKDSRIDRIQGTGLGLAIVKEIVDLMDGSIECQSEPNKGTKFIVSLDLPLAEERTENLSLPGLRLLVVDDDEIFLESAVDLLSEMGAKAETANDGKKALALIEARRQAGEEYPLVIVDWKMPGMDGLETIKAIRELLGDEIPIILVSAYDWTDIEDEALKSGASGFISKPLFRTSIYEKLCEILKLSDEPVVSEAAQENDLRGRRLLIAEDNELNWEVISELLDMYGITTENAANGEICVDMLETSAPGTYDLVLMDVQMPVMNGREATLAIRKSKREDLRAIPIVAMTADAFAEDIAACLASGMDGHVSKPVDMDKLFQELRRLLIHRKPS